jgi:hypothetical protein
LHSFPLSTEIVRGVLRNLPSRSSTPITAALPIDCPTSIAMLSRV